MARIPPLEPPYGPKLQASFDAVMGGAPPLLLFRTLALSERAWRKVSAGSLLDGGPLSLREREIVIDRTCALAGCGYEWGVHVAAFATRAGLSEAEVAATAAASSACPSWSAAERALLAAVEALDARATLSEAEFQALRACYDVGQVLEILMLCGFYRTVAYVANALDLEPEPFAAPLPEPAKASR
jgi:alkylhydroperoxidase family enzyme